jgi:hypothetical protein
MDTLITGTGIYQPVLFAGQIQDPETVAWQNNGTTMHRPGLALAQGRSYDPFVGAHIQVDQRAPSSWSPYIFLKNNPVGGYRHLKDTRVDGVGTSAFSMDALASHGCGPIGMPSDYQSGGAGCLGCQDGISDRYIDPSGGGSRPCFYACLDRTRSPGGSEQRRSRLAS